jgi:hypothetical protein
MDGFLTPTFISSMDNDLSYGATMPDRDGLCLQDQLSPALDMPDFQTEALLATVVSSRTGILEAQDLAGPLFQHSQGLPLAVDEKLVPTITAPMVAANL